MTVPPALRRLAAGLAAFSAVWAAAPAAAAPCPDAGTLALGVSCLVRSPLRGGLALAGWAAAVAAGVFVLAFRGHGALELAVGGVVGALLGAFAFGGSLRFLENERPLSRMAFEARNLMAILFSRGQARWDEDYEAGHWAFLDSQPQRARHHVASGLIADSFPDGARVLDLGCGLGTLRGALRGGSYHGVDLSQRAVAECRRRHGTVAATTFEAADFLRLRSDEGYDAVVLNEVLYYLRPGEVVPAFRCAAARVAPSGGIVVVSMNRSLKSRLVWVLLAGALRPERSLRISDLGTGSAWTIKSFRPSGPCFVPQDCG